MTAAEVQCWEGLHVTKEMAEMLKERCCVSRAYRLGEFFTNSENVITAGTGCSG